MNLFEFTYFLNIIAAPFAQPYWVYFFLGDVPLSPDQFGGAAVASQYIYPGTPTNIAGDTPKLHGYTQAAIAKPAAVAKFAKRDDDSNETGSDADTTTVVTGTETPNTDLVNDIIDTARFAKAHGGAAAAARLVARSQDITKQFQGSVSAQLPFTAKLKERVAPGDNVLSYLKANLKWRVVIPLQGEPKDLPPMRAYVSRSEKGSTSKRQIVWPASEGKNGGLNRGELPALEKSYSG
jgi:hypothetical protein